MNKGSIGSLMLPIMVASPDFFKKWNLQLGGGSLEEEIIPFDVLWINDTHVLIVNPNGDYLTKE